MKREGADPVVVLATGAIGYTLHRRRSLAAAFLVSPATSVITTVAAASEIPRRDVRLGLLAEARQDRRGVVAVHGVAVVATALGTLCSSNRPQ